MQHHFISITDPCSILHNYIAAEGSRDGVFPHASLHYLPIPFITLSSCKMDVIEVKNTHTHTLLCVPYIYGGVFHGSFFFTLFLFTSFGEQDEAYINSLRWSALVGLEHPHVSRPLYHCATDADGSFICKHLFE